MIDASTRVDEMENIVLALKEQWVDLLQRKSEASTQEQTVELEELLMKVKRDLEDTVQTSQLLKEIYGSKKEAYARWLDQEEQLHRGRVLHGSAFSLENSMNFGNITSVMKERRVPVPQQLPKFRQNGSCEEPGEFLEAFRRVLEAHDVPNVKYAKLLPLCLDTVDNQWLDEWVKQHNGQVLWENLESAFIGHFQNPNTVMLWQEQIRSLKMDSFQVFPEVH